MERGHERRELRPPTVDGCEYLVNYLFEVGPGSGEGALTFLEIEAWCSLTGRELQPWEVLALRRLSGAYVSEAFDATEKDRPAPLFVPSEMSREEVADKIGGILSRWERQDGGGDS